MASYIKTGKNGSLTTYAITGTETELASIAAGIKNITTYPLRTTDSGISGKGSKSDVSSIKSLVESHIEKPSSNSSGQRVIELMSVAVANGLNHGKSWVCDGYTVDKNSLNPSWEGAQICYVYS